MLSVLMLFITGIVVALFAGPVPAIGAITSSLQSILRNTHGSKDYGYPTDLTRDLLPVIWNCPTSNWSNIDLEIATIGVMNHFILVRHSGNLDLIVISSSPTRFVSWLYIHGSRCLALQWHTICTQPESFCIIMLIEPEQRTLESLYINPILDVLERQNPESPFLTSATKNGVWDTVPDQTLYFFIDVKTSGHETFKAVIDALEPLRAKGYLTTVKDGKTVINGAVTIIGTGETPLDMVAPVKDRDYFFDAPLADLNDPKYADITGIVSPVASTDFDKAVGKITVDTDPILSEDQLKALRAQIATANERGIGARYWNTPYFPIRKRNLVWRTLLREGVILLNADDLDAVTAYF
ncbi:hypothetical protein N7508_002207 [Penicillium antarcticum]|uniref:uncharacterized protein n=1 Tax=Penicillium antarcticum TaxID=416450 RepID=UPI0023A63CEE|nr:uncharacterized protein N7508_002207 [Penicillium antarcticum]KAJ5317699.1 hypothetical protein N7508_002207 [Penicillium antarcticum]